MEDWARMSTKPFGIAGADIKTGQALMVDPRNGTIVPATASRAHAQAEETMSSAKVSERVGEFMRQRAIARRRAAIDASGVKMGDDYVEASIDAHILATICALERHAAVEERRDDQTDRVWHDLWRQVRAILNRETRDGEDCIETLRRLVSEARDVRRYESGEAECKVRAALGAATSETTFGAAKRVMREREQQKADLYKLAGSCEALEGVLACIGEAVPFKFDCISPHPVLRAVHHLVEQYEKRGVELDAREPLRQALGARDHETTMGAATRVAQERDTAREANRTVGTDAYRRGVVEGLQQAVCIIADTPGRGDIGRLEAWGRIRGARDAARKSVDSPCTCKTNTHTHAAWCPAHSGA